MKAFKTLWLNLVAVKEIASPAIALKLLEFSASIFWGWVGGYLRIHKNFMSRICIRAPISKFSCRENFVIYSTLFNIKSLSPTALHVRILVILTYIK